MTEPLATERARLAPTEILLLGLVVALARVLATRFVFIYDDAFITFRYAANLAAGHGMVFNPGAAWEPVLGTTTPGYTALIAILVSAGFEAVRASLALNVLCDVGSALLLVHLLGRERVVSTLAVFGFAMMPEILRISMGGMEAPVLCFLTLAATSAAGRGRFGVAGLLAAIACTIRPEAVLLVAVLGVRARHDVRKLVAFLTPVGLIGVAYTVALVSVYGSPIPHSVTSKSARHGDSPTLATWAEILRQGFLPRLEYVLVLPFALYGMIRAMSARIGPAVLFGVAILAAYFVARPHTWGWYYYLPLFAWVVGAAFGLAPLVRRIGRAVPPLAGVARFASAGVLLALGAATLLVGQRDPVTERVYRPMEEWAREVQLAESGATLLASDIGAIGYYGKGLVYDSEGLTLPDALNFDGQIEMVERYRPDYLMLTAVRARVGPLRDHEEITRDYYPVRRFSRAGATELEPALEDLPETWRQDYLLYRRRL